MKSGKMDRVYFQDRLYDGFPYAREALRDAELFLCDNGHMLLGNLRPLNRRLGGYEIWRCRDAKASLNRDRANSGCDLGVL